VPNRAETVRRLIERSLTATSNGVVLSDGEKLIIGILEDMSESMKLPEKGLANFAVSAIVGGHYWAIPMDRSGLFAPDRDTREELAEVFDILEMWSHLERCYATLSKADKARVKAEAEQFVERVKFPGFDGNEEGTHFSIALFLTREMNRYANFKQRDLNSHFPHLATYRRMVAVFKPLAENLRGDHLSVDELIRILRQS
jgi:uncharacterized protein YfbU (UPF0304 family)